MIPMNEGKRELRTGYRVGCDLRPAYRLVIFSIANIDNKVIQIRE